MIHNKSVKAFNFMLISSIVVSLMTLTNNNMAGETNPASGTYSESIWLSPEKRMECVELSISGNKSALERLLRHYSSFGKDDRQLLFWAEYGDKIGDKYARELLTLLKKK